MNPRFLTIENQKIAVFNTVNPIFPDIVFVHGNSLSAFTYQSQFDSQLVDQYHLVAFDLPGHGLSEPAKNPGTMYSSSKQS